MEFVARSTRKPLILDPDATLGAGGEARVFVVPSDDASVAKIYRRPTEHHARKLAVMLANPPADPMAAQGHVSIAWPVELVETLVPAGRIVGFLMPRAQGTRPLIDFYNPATRRKVCPLFNPLYLLRTARNLAAAVHAVHSRGYVIGDINESNILVTDTALVTLVDTDSFQVRDPKTGEMFRCPVGKPEFTPPELQGEVFREIDRSPEHDRFGLAVLIFQLLMEGTHPYGGLYTGEGDPPPYAQRIQDGHFQYGDRSTPFRPMPVAPAFDTLPPELRALFVSCFDAGHADPTARPDAETWISALQETEIEQVICRVNDQHRYGKHLNACPWCIRRLRFDGRDPFPSKEVVRRGEHLKSAEPSQYRLPSAVSIVPAAVPMPDTAVVAAPASAVPGPSTDGHASLGLQPTVPAPSVRPAITATRGAPARAAGAQARTRLWVLVIGLAGVGVLLSLMGFALMNQRAIAGEVDLARRALTSAQMARSRLHAGSLSPADALSELTALRAQVKEAQRRSEEALRLSGGKSAEASSIRREADAAARAGEADQESLQARTELDEVVRTIDKYKNETLSAAEADKLKRSLREKCRSALDHCERALLLAPEMPAAWAQRVRSYRLMGDAESAKRTAIDAVARFPGEAAIQEQQSLLEGG